MRNINILDRRKVDFSWSKVLLTIALLGALIGAIFATKILFDVESSIAKAKEDARPANVKLTKITVPNCSDCFNVDTAVATLKQQNIKLTEQKTVSFTSSEAEKLIKELRIKRVPTYILNGETTKENLEAFTKSNGEVKNGTFIFTKVLPVFIDPTTKKEMGRVTVTYLTDALCTQCINPKHTIESYKKSGVKVVDEKEIDWQTGEGQAIIAKYKITKFPTFLLSQDIELYETVKNSWVRMGTVEDDKTYVARNLLLPYRDLEKGKILGMVDVVYLTDSSCSECYKPEVTQRSILKQGYRMGIGSERTIDSSSYEGQNLIKQYKITKVPTVLLSPDADQYISLKNVWKNVGTIETDGWYVFRELHRLARVTYKDLVNNQVVKPAPLPTGGQ